MSYAKALRPKPIVRIEGAAKSEAAEDMLAAEEPLEIRVAGHSVAVVMRTPGHDRELVAGFLVTEGIVRRRDEILDMVRCGADPASRDPSGSTGSPPAGAGSAGGGGEASENVIDVLLAPGFAVDFARLTRHVFTSSSCGICSRASIDAVRGAFPPIAAPLSPRRGVLAALPERLRAAQAAFAATGGLHASALFDSSGTLEVVREDVGRHNALDKVIGHAFFAEKLPLAGRILLVSGRVSFEIMQKALAAGIPCVAAISAPTSAAVEFAQESGQALVGFLRPSTGSTSSRQANSHLRQGFGGQAGPGAMRMNVYAGTLAE